MNEIKFYRHFFRKKGASAANSQCLALRSALLNSLTTELVKTGWTQKEAAKKLAVQQPRISELYSGAIDKFSAELLVKYLYLIDKRVHLTTTDAQSSLLVNRKASTPENHCRLLRSILCAELKNELLKSGWKQKTAAEKLGIKQPRISEILSDTLDKFSAEILVKYLYLLGKEVNLTLVDPNSKTPP